MEWVCIALISMVVGVTAHHLGLTEEVSKIVGKIAECPKCCSFWTSMAALTYMGCDILISLTLSMFVAYLSFYFGLVLILLQKLYDWLWQKVNR